MTRLRAIVITLAAMAGCATPLTVAEPRDGGAGTPPPQGFGETGPLDSGFEGDSDFVADPPSLDGGQDG